MIETSTIAELTRARSKSEPTIQQWHSLEKKPKTFLLVKLKTKQGPIVSGWWTGGDWDGAWGNKYFTVEAWAPYEGRNYP